MAYAARFACCKPSTRCRGTDPADGLPNGGFRAIGSPNLSVWLTVQLPEPSTYETHEWTFSPPFPLPNFGRLFIVANDQLATLAIH
ncbi:hypothetical protein SFC76_19130 [Sphingomonas sp. CD22]|uniref:hypothetical protein n=1 Tax=Sphingomonas sp. CD22 TaxID=3100214 RepID=UPI002ADFC666|nr:hypothetical protein [Sphingomonas sp. CD22]MEA1086391.1 hypothetical protein [Sphingomonas sp. CD22]